MKIMNDRRRTIVKSVSPVATVSLADAALQQQYIRYHGVASGRRTETGSGQSRNNDRSAAGTKPFFSSERRTTSVVHGLSCRGRVQLFDGQRRSGTCSPLLRTTDARHNRRYGRHQSAADAHRLRVLPGVGRRQSPQR